MAKSTENKIIDYISGVELNATPEEVEAVQVFSRQLVEDYGYKGPTKQDLNSELR